MERGEIKHSTHIDQADAQTVQFVEQVIEELVLSLGEGARSAIYVSSQELASEHHQPGSGVESNNVLTIVWHNSTPAALALETRDEYNRTNVHTIYLGPMEGIFTDDKTLVDEESNNSGINEKILAEMELLRMQNNFGLINNAQYDTQLRALQKNLYL